MAEPPSVQDRYLAEGLCFGCGPANPQGLGLRSFPGAAPGEVVAEWHPQPHHQAGTGVLNGGIIGTLMDCHSGAAVASAVQARTGRWPFAESDPWVTAAYEVRLRRPTPIDAPVRLHARVTEIDDDEAVVEVELASGETVRATATARWRRRRPR